MKTKHKSLIKTLFVIGIYIAIIVITWSLLKYFKLNNITTLKHICNNSFLGHLVFVLLQVIQVVFLPINSIIFIIPAIIIFGPAKAFVISYIGLIIGSIIMFFIGRFGGIGILKWIVGDEKAYKYKKILGKGKFILPIFMLLAIFPDDLLCVSAGMSDIDFGYFLLVILATRAIDLACTCFIGTHAVKSPLGIALLVIFIIIAIILSITLTKKQDKLENWAIKTFSRK